ncbi:MAG: transcriptional regulator [Streptosporangiaceae bacterium]|jgi:DNA-binding transcriptional ArsR family regulator
MDPDSDLASVAALIADRNRSQMLLVLLGGTPQSGSALAEAAGISRALASAHLKKLVAGRLVAVRPNGRQQMYSIASEPVADALEILGLLAAQTPARSLRESTRAQSLRWARMCYDHLAGTVGVAIIEALIARELVEPRDGLYLLGPAGAAGFAEFGVDATKLARHDRPLLRPCMDWSERRYHLAGSIGAALTAELKSRRWIAGREASRAVTVTPAGRDGLRSWLHIDLDGLRAAA